MIFQDASKRIPYEELEDTSVLLDLCNGIYIARKASDLETEYEFYYELIRIYRSPELLIQVSKPRAGRRALGALRGGARALRFGAGAAESSRPPEAQARDAALGGQAD